MVWLPLERWKEQRTFWIGLKSREPKRCRLRFQPLCISGEPDWNPRWEEWHCYLFPLAMGIEDYQLLLADYFARIYPTQDAFSGTPEEGLDPCGPNWLGAGKSSFCASGRSWGGAPKSGPGFMRLFSAGWRRR